MLHAQSRPVGRAFSAACTALGYLVLSLGGVWSSGGLATAQDDRADLRWRWVAGSRVPYLLTEHLDQRISGPLEARLVWVRRLDYLDEVLTVGPDGAEVRRSFDRVRVEATRDAEATVRYDSQTDPAPTDLLLAPMAGLAGREVTFTVDDEGRVGSVRGADEALDAVLGPLAVGPLAEGIGAFAGQPDRAERVARQIEQGLALIPGRPVRRGESWDMTIDHVVPVAGGVRSETAAVLRTFDARRGLAEILLTGTVTRAPGGGAGVLGIGLESGTVSGSVYFDTRAGAVARSDMMMRTSWVIGAGLTGDGEPIRQQLEQRALLERQRDGSRDDGSPANGSTSTP